MAFVTTSPLALAAAASFLGGEGGQRDDGGAAASTRCGGSVFFASRAIVSVYKGVLEEIGPGKDIPKGTGVWTTRITYGGYGSAVTKERKNPLGGWTRRDFIDVGGTKISQVLLAPEFESLLNSAVGQEVEIGVSKNGKGYKVEAIRTPRDGVVKPSLLSMLFVYFVVLLKMVVVLVVAALIGLVASAIVVAIVGDQTIVLIGCAIGVGALLLRVIWENVRGIGRSWSAWSGV